MGLIEIHLEDLCGVWPHATGEPRADGTHLITVPAMVLPPGWNQTVTTVQFLAPVGYPLAHPDCFWADEGLRLGDGRLPKNAGVQPPPFGGAQKLWFSWHVSTWNGSRDTLRSFVGAVANRFTTIE